MSVTKTEEQIRAEAITEFAGKLIKYYESLSGSTNGFLVAYTIREKAKEFENLLKGR